VRAIRLNNPGRPIPRARVLGFPSVEAANAYELANPQIVAGGLFFQCDPLGNLAFVVQSNSTVRCVACSLHRHSRRSTDAGLSHHLHDMDRFVSKQAQQSV